MDDKKIPYIVYESAQARNERTIKRLTIIAIIAIALMFLSNVAWLYMWTSYDYSGEEIVYSQDGEGINAINTGKQDNVRYINGTEDDYPETETD